MNKFSNNELVSSTTIREDSYFSQLEHPEENLRNELQLILRDKPSAENNHKIKLISNQLLEQFELSISEENLLSLNSIKSVKFNWNKFLTWCENKSFRFLPATALTFENFLLEHSLNCKANSLQVYVWAVNTVHNAAGLPSPTRSQRIKNLLKGIKKKKARSGEVISQVSPFKEQHLDCLIVIWQNSQRIIDLRNLSLLCFSYETLLRESELSRVRFNDLYFRDDGRAILTIPFTKTNHSGLADKVLLSRQCVTLLKNYIKQSGMPMTGIIFRPVLKSNRIKWLNNLVEYKDQKPLSGSR